MEFSDDLLHKIAADLAALRASVEVELRQHANRLDAAEPRIQTLEQEMAKTRGYTVGVSAAFGLFITLVNVALMMLK